MTSLNVPKPKTQRIVILGGGFAGLELTKKLSKSSYQIVLLDRNNYHTFQPLLYQVATAGLEAESVAYPFREIFKNFKDVHFRMCHIKGVDLSSKIVKTSRGDITFDYLVLGLGSKTNFFGMDDFKKHAKRMKTVPQAAELRNLILDNFEKAVTLSDQTLRQPLMNFVVIGGGPTGVELSGALAELKKLILPKDYPHLDLNKMNIILIDMADCLLSTMSTKASRFAQHVLETSGVVIKLSTKVKAYDGEVLTLSKDEKIKTQNVIWTAGVKGVVIPGLDSARIDKSGRIEVDRLSRVIGCKDVFAIGDIAMMKTPNFPKGCPMLAPVAIQQAERLAKNLIRMTSSEPLKEFEYRNKGYMATIGRNKAVADLSKFSFKGTFAWLIWLFIHLMALVGFRNRLITFINWLWSYLGYERALRIIFHKRNEDNL